MTFRTKIEFSDSIEGVSDFMKRERTSSDIENFGREISQSEWNRPLTIIVYKEQKDLEIVGVAKCTIIGNTIRLSLLLVKKEHRSKKGIGSRIIMELEKLSQKNQWHKIRLTTIHQNVEFYKKNGFNIEATLENDVFGLKWFIMSKFIEK
jgi:ribosomal protein S18 acetylase RimI-like enzyme